MTKTSTKTLVCTDCLGEFDGNPRAKRCERCRADHKKAKGRERQQAWRAARPKALRPDPICEDCGETFEHAAANGRSTKKFCEPCRLERVRVTVRESMRRRRAAEGPMQRTCADCLADITGTPSNTKRCPPCSKAHSRDRMSIYLREWKRAQPKTVFTCATCEEVIDRKNKSGVATYCDNCREAAQRRTRRRSVAKRREKVGTTYATHCHYCGDEFDRPRQRGRAPNRCEECKRQVLYAYKRSLTTASRPTVSTCRDCGDPVQVKRKGPKSIRCAPCVQEARRLKWLQYAETYRHMRRAWKYAVGYERFSPKEIYERDRWRCGVCRKQISRKLRHPNPKSVSLDHKISLSRGGPHSRRNAQPAHLLCNIRKNKYDALPGEQMPLPIVF